jgi:hypothetical protein
MASEGRMRRDIQRPIDIIVEIINESCTTCGMTKEDTEKLRTALEDLVASIKR